MDAKKHFWVDYLACLIFGAVIVPLSYCYGGPNYRQIGGWSVVVAVAVFTGIHVVCFWGFGLFLKEKEKRLFSLYCAWCFFWFIIPIGRKFIFLCGAFYQYRWLFVGSLAVVLFFSLLFFLKRSKPIFFLKLQSFMSLFVWLLFFIILLFVVCCHLFALYFRRFPDGEGGKIEGNYQNIYYILLDAHPSGEAFRQLGGDLKSFYCELERLGFITYPASKSVYPRTVESVASVWHMDTEVHDSIIDSAALKTLMKTYTVRYYLGSRFVLWLYGYPAVDNVKLVFSRDLLFALDVLLERSLLCRYHDRVSGGRKKKNKQKDVRLILDYLENGKRLYGSSGNFFCAHIFTPHFPLVFSEGVNRCVEANLNAVRDSDFGGVCYGELLCSLLQQEVYAIDSLVLKTIKAILKEYESETQKPIIVLCSDHGILNRIDASGFVARPPYLTEKTVYGNLFAIYMPEEWKKDAKDLKFINLYRFIFNHLFGTNYEYLPDVRKNIDGSIFKEKTLPSSEP